MTFPSNWLTFALKLFWIKSSCIFPSHWLLTKKNSLLLYHILVICLLLFYRIVLSIIIIVLFLSPRHVSVIFFCFKDKLSFNLCSNVVYKFSCGRCNATSFGETCRLLNVRVGEHSRVSPLTGKKSKAKTTTAIKDIHREKASSNKTSALTKSKSMDIWVVGESNQLSIIGC